MREPITRRQMLTITLAGTFIVYLLWNVDFLSFIAYPFRLFVTYVHEAGHSLMAIITGGRVLEFTVSPNGSGLATTAGGSRALILPAGYIGAAFFGASLFYLVNRHPRFARGIGGMLGVFLIVFTLMFARPDAGNAPTAIIVGFFTGLALVGLVWKGSLRINLLVLSVLSIMTALNAVLDVVTLIRYADMQIASGIVRNDAAAFSEEIAGGFLPGSFWALMWAGIALTMCGFSVYYGLIKPWLKGDTTITPKNDGTKDFKRTADGEIDFSQF